MMLKSAQKQHTNARHITTRHRLQGNNVQERTRMKMLDVQGQIRGPVGVVRMNREHRHNALTPNFIK